MLIEVMIGALVLALATAAVLDGLDGAQATGRANKDRSTAATLAQQDIERLRALPIVALAGRDETRNVDVSGVRYGVHSTTTWMRDNSTELSCTDDTSQAAYLKVSSTATAPASAAHPVSESTLITPPAAFSTTTGTATVKTSNRDGTPLAGVTVQLAGPASYSGTTNDLGCAIFSFIEPGAYTATFPGNYVSWDSERPVSLSVNVIAGKATPVQAELEAPASLRVSFKTPTGAAASWTNVSVPHPNLPGGFKVFSVGSAKAQIDATDLFPQKDGYGVYAGTCEANNPANPFWGDPDYFINHPASHADTPPGAALVPVDAVMPVLQIVAKRSKSRDLYVRIDQSDNPNEDVDCRQQEIVLRKLQNAKPGGSGSVTTTETFALPFGNYRVCIDDNNNRKSTNVELTSPTTVSWGTTTPAAPVDLTTGTTSGKCPDPF
jgi:Tfp pilus assembly protein PilV